MIERTLKMTDEELAELDLLVHQELSSSAVELHHTKNPDYRDRVKQRITAMEGLARKIEIARPADAALAGP